MMMMGHETGREVKLSEIRTCLDSLEFKAVSLESGYEYSYCTLTPLFPSDNGWVVFHWYDDYQWYARGYIVEIDVILLAAHSPTAMFHFISGLMLEKKHI